MKRILCFSMFILFCAACSANSDQVRTAVLDYINAVAGIYSGRQSETGKIVSGHQLELSRQSVDDFAGRSVRVEPSLRSIRFVQVSFPAAEEALVVTEESWDFRYLSARTGRELRTKSYDLPRRYRLEKEGLQWKVMDSGPRDKDTLRTSDPFAALPADLIATGRDEEESRRLEDSVRSYLALLTEGYSRQDMTPLLRSATKRRAMKAYYHMSSMGEGQVRMVPVLRDIEIHAAEVGNGGTGRVMTTEEWDYSYFSTQTNEKIYENNVHYTLTYELVKDVENRWLVDNIIIQQFDQGEGKGELPFFLRPHGAQTEAGGEQQ